MKKFKLIKTYPGSPELGTVIIESTVFTSSVGNSITYMPKGDSSFRIKYPMTYPEFWEEVVEKDYEILSFAWSNKTGRDIYANASRDSETMMIKNGYEINSVKRLSDGEVFTVGDEIKTPSSTSYCSIYDIIIRDNYVIIGCTHSLLASQQKIYLFEVINHIKYPLFTTEDNVDIFKGDKYWAVAKRYIYESTIDSEYEINAFDIEKNQTWFEQHNWANFWSFSTKERAEKYILFNKPSLSLNDILSITIPPIHKIEKLKNIIRLKSE